MKITEYGTIRSASDIKRRRTGSAGSSSFADILEAASSDEPSATASLSDIAASSPVANMLGLQEISEEEIQRKKLVARGNNLLDSLDNLRQQLLMGTVPLHTLQQLGSQLSQQRQNVNDPRLLALMDDIELRAAVELAKLEVAAAAQSPAPFGEEE